MRKSVVIFFYLQYSISLAGPHKKTAGWFIAAVDKRCLNI